MAPEPNKDASEGGYSPHMKTVGWAIVTMGVSLVLVIVAWMWIGYIGPNYSAGERRSSRQPWWSSTGCRPAQQTSAAELEIPPSLRGLTSAGNAINATSASSNATGGNQTTASNGTAAAPASGGTKVSTTQGAVSKTTDACDPNPVQTKVGDKVTLPHTRRHQARTQSRTVRSIPARWHSARALASRLKRRANICTFARSIQI